MELLDQIIGTLPPEQTTMGGGGLPAAIMSLLTPRSGGLNSLMEGFGSAGLGHIFQSWVGNGPNQAISPQNLHRALGEAQVQTMANGAGMPRDQLLPMLAQFLPTIVDKLTPQGQVPQGDLVNHDGGIRV